MRTIVKFIIQLKQKLNYEKCPLVVYECHSLNADSNGSHVWQENNAQFYLGCCLYVRTTNEKKQVNTLRFHANISKVKRTM